MESNRNFFLRRALAEQHRARHAMTSAAQRRHLDLAQVFSAKATVESERIPEATDPRIEWPIGR